VTVDSKSAAVRLMTSEGVSSATTKAAKRDKRGAADKKRIFERCAEDSKVEEDWNGIYITTSDVSRSPADANYGRSKY